MVNRLPAVQKTQVQSLGREDPLEKGMDIHSSTLAWRIPWAEEPGGLQSMELRQSITRQVNKKSRVPEEEKGSGALKEEIRVSILKEEKRTNIFSIFLNFSHIKLFFL